MVARAKLTLAEQRGANPALAVRIAGSRPVERASRPAAFTEQPEAEDENAAEVEDGAVRAVRATRVRLVCALRRFVGDARATEAAGLCEDEEGGHVQHD